MKPAILASALLATVLTGTAFAQSGTPIKLADVAELSGGGATVMTGRELAIYQAADAFELFTGLVPSIAEMGIAFDDVMAKRYAASYAA